MKNKIALALALILAVSVSADADYVSQQRSYQKIVYMSGGEAALANGGDPTINFSPAPATGDLVVVCSGWPSSASGGAILTSGYTSVADLSSGGYALSCGYKVMGATPDTSVQTEGGGSASDAASAVALIFRGVHTTSVTSATTITATGTSTNPNPGSITPTVAETIVVVGCSSGSATDTTVVAPTNYEAQQDVTADDTNDSTTGMAYRRWQAGAEDPATWTTWSSGDWACATIALRPVGR